MFTVSKLMEKWVLLYIYGGKILSPTYYVSFLSHEESPSHIAYLSLPVNHLFLWEEGLIWLWSSKNETARLHNLVSSFSHSLDSTQLKISKLSLLHLYFLILWLRDQAGKTAPTQGLPEGILSNSVIQCRKFTCLQN